MVPILAKGAVQVTNARGKAIFSVEIEDKLGPLALIDRGLGVFFAQVVYLGSQKKTTVAEDHGPHPKDGFDIGRNTSSPKSVS